MKQSVDGRTIVCGDPICKYFIDGFGPLESKRANKKRKGEDGNLAIKRPINWQVDRKTTKNVDREEDALVNGIIGVW